MASVLKIQEMDLFKDEKVIKLINYIKESIKNTVYEGHVFVVGGAVRDSLMGKPCKDIDLVIDLPTGGLGFANFLTFKNNCYTKDKNPVVFETYGTAKLQLLNSDEFNDIEIECVNTRKEQYHSESRNPTTSFGTIEQDAMRRDLTINAIYYDISNDELRDYTGKGIDDIKNKVIRTPTDPDIIFNDDPLRILRVIRFATRFEWGIEKKTWLGMVKNAKRILIVSQERITEEISKILLTNKPSLGIKRMLCCNNLLEYTIPCADFMKHIYQNMNPKITVLQHSLDVLDNTEPKLVNRLAGLLHDIGKLTTYNKAFLFHAAEGSVLAEKMLKAMKYPNSVISKVCVCIALHETFSAYRDKETPKKSVLREFKAITGDNYETVMDVIHSNNCNQLYLAKPNQAPLIKKKIKEMEKAEKRNLSVIKLPINGKDIINKFNIKSGPLIGRLLKKIKDAYLEDPTITKDDCFDIVNDYIKKTV